jgi:hypothetical protein
MSNLSRKPSSAVISSRARVVLVASAGFLLVAIFILVSAVASPISRGSGTAPTPTSAPVTNTVPSTATSTPSPTPPLGAPTPSTLLQFFALGGALVVLVVLLLGATRERNEE